MVWIDNGDMGTSYTGNFIELFANFRLESGGRCRLVKDLLTRYFNSSTMVLFKESARGIRGLITRTYLKGAVTKEDGLGGHNGLKRAEEREEP